MENRKNPAFHCFNPDHDGNRNKDPQIYGLTKLEYASIMAMQGILSGNDYVQNEESGQISIATASIECAKELLKQLEQQETK